jgi:antirestriction protein ArdC
MPPAAIQRCVIEDRGFTGQNWLTFRQALKLGTHVRNG